MTSVEDILSDLVVGTAADEIPSDARQAAVRQLFDCVGVTLAAAAQPAGRVIAEVTEVLGGSDHARVLGTPLRSSIAGAAWANGSLAHLLDFDDTGFSHPTACILPASLAVGEWLGASGREVVAAMVLGYEVFERLAASARKHEPVLRQRGVHPTTIWGCPAAAAAAGRLMGLDRRQVRIAFGIAATSASGLTQQFGTWSKGLNAGNAARTGVTAALLARAGYQGDELGISGTYGLFASVVGHGNYDFSGIERDLGTRWSIADPGISIKPYPACTSTLRAVDAMLKIGSRAGYAPGSVQRIVVHVHPDLLHTLRFRAPTDGFRGKFSLDYTVAAAALDQALTLDSFTDEAAARPAFRAMLARVELREHPEWDIANRHDNPIAVTLADGRVLEESVPAHRGSRAWPLSAEEITEKFLGCAKQSLPAAQAEQSVEALLSIEAAPDVRRVVDLLVPR